MALARALFRRSASSTAAGFTSGPVMIVLAAVAFRLFVRGRLVPAAHEQAGKGPGGLDEGPPGDGQA
jgi:hypothetical protein